MPSIFDLLDQQKNSSPQENLSPETTPKSQNRSIFDVLEDPVSSVFDESAKENIGEDLPMQATAAIQEGSQPQQQLFEDENEIERGAERGQAQATSRIIETLVGLPGDIQKFAKSVLGFSTGGFELPGSKEIKEGIGKLTKGYTLPENEFEEKVGEFVSDVASFAIPGSKTYSLARNIGIPLAGSFVKESLKDFGTDEKNSSYAKIGTMIALDLMQARKGGARKFASDLFNESEKLVPKGQTIPAKNIETSLKSLRKDLSLGGEKAPSTAKAINQIDDILNQVKDGKIEVGELIARRKKLNEAIQEKGGFDIRLPKNIEKKVVSNLEKVKGKVIDGIDEYGKINPKFGEINRAANESWTAYSQSNVISNFIHKNFHKALKSNGAKLLFGLGGSGLVAAAAKTTPFLTASSASFVAPYAAMKVAIRVSKSPSLRKYYQGVLTSAASGNISQLNQNLRSLDEKLENEEKKESQREKDLLKK